MWQVLTRGKAHRPFRRLKRYRTVMLARNEQNGAAKPLIVRLRGRERLVELFPAFSARAEQCARFHSQSSVAGAIYEHFRGENVFRLGKGAGSQYRGDAFGGGHPDAMTVRVQKQCDVRLTTHLVVQQQVPHAGAALGVVHCVLQAQLFQNTRFPRVGILTTTAAIRAADMHTYLAGRVAAEHRAVVYENDMCTTPGGGKSCAHSGHAAANNDDIGLHALRFHASGFCYFSSHGAGKWLCTATRSPVSADFCAASITSST
ncbi:hypothetical protein HRbin16_00806 [bacterium HR16]|nr:hypothetical protein HRbin16_00806 [bacterium HR16]